MEAWRGGGLELPVGGVRYDSLRGGGLELPVGV